MEIKTNCYCTDDLQQMNHTIKPKEIKENTYFFPLCIVTVPTTFSSKTCAKLSIRMELILVRYVLIKNVHFFAHLFFPSVNFTETFAKTCFTPRRVRPNLGTFYHVQSKIINNLLANNLQNIDIQQQTIHKSSIYQIGIYLLISTCPGKVDRKSVCNLLIFFK